MEELASMFRQMLVDEGAIILETPSQTLKTTSNTTSNTTSATFKPKSHKPNTKKKRSHSSITAFLSPKQTTKHNSNNKKSRGERKVRFT